MLQSVLTGVLATPLLVIRSDHFVNRNEAVYRATAGESMMSGVIERSLELNGGESGQWTRQRSYEATPAMPEGVAERRGGDEDDPTGASALDI